MMLEQVLGLYSHHLDLNSLEIHSLGNAGGFSGARLWKLVDGNRSYCLRRWPAKTGIEKVQNDHRLIKLAAKSGCEFLAVPIESRNQLSVQAIGHHLWQLEPWMPGQANYWASPSSTKLESAMSALASFHVAVSKAEYDNTRPDEANVWTKSCPAIETRIARLDELHQGRFAEIEIACRKNARQLANSARWMELGQKACEFFRIYSKRVAAELRSLASCQFRIAPSIRDVWHDHVFFEGDRVSALIDLGAMRVDSQTVDVARLVGSFCFADQNHADRSEAKLAIKFYNDAVGRWAARHEFKIAKLSGDEMNLLSVLDRSTQLISPLNWLQWLFIENREFENYDSVSNRIQTFVARSHEMHADSFRSIFEF